MTERPRKHHRPRVHQRTDSSPQRPEALGDGTVGDGSVGDWALGSETVGEGAIGNAALADFHPAVAAWFAERFDAPTPAQARGWPAIRQGRHTLIAAPTGSGKTLAAFLAAIDGLVVESLDGGLPDETRILYVSPLKALGNDVSKNLREPLRGIRRQLEATGHPEHGIRVAVRSGDTPSSERTAMTRRPPHILVTTPESLYLLLTSQGGRGLLKTVETVIVDEVHAVIENKRGTHLALSLERLSALTPADPVRIGLSATQRPMDAVADFLVGDRAHPVVVDLGHRRAMDLSIEVPDSPLEAVMAAEVWSEVYDRLADLVSDHRTTLVFVNTRRMAERVTRHLEERLGEAAVAAHHGSLSKEQRLSAEQRLKAGGLRAIVATASLELGIDVGAVDLVCQLGSTRSIASALQRVGRSGHAVGAVPKGVVFPLSRDELVEAAALLEAVGRGELDHLVIPSGSLDILAQQIVAEVSAAEWPADDLLACYRRSAPYRNLSDAEYGAVVDMLADGFTTRRGRRGAYLHFDRVNRRLRPRKAANLAALTSGGAIPETGDFDVVEDPAGIRVGSVNEDFAIESMPGDIFQLGNMSWRIERVETGVVRVSDAHGLPPTIPFWLGEAPARSRELCEAVAGMRSAVARHLGDDGAGADAAVAWLVEIGLSWAAAEQLVDYLAASLGALGRLPTLDCLVAERFFDEAGNMHVVIHSPWGSDVNQAWGLALRKRFCRTFNFELQAAATEDAIVLSLGPTHSFPVDDVFRMLPASAARDVLVQALLDSPLFTTRWRWNVGRALAVLRRFGHRRNPPHIQRMQAEDLIAVVFPDQLACLENIVGEREVPDHPLVNQTIDDCLTEAMDIDALVELLAGIGEGRIQAVGLDLPAPSPMAQGVLTARPFAFLDDAPLEERRTQAVAMRRWLDDETAERFGALDGEAVQRVIDEAWPEASSPDEVHDALYLAGFILTAEADASGWTAALDALAADGRACRMTPKSDGLRPSDPVSGAGARGLWVATERLPELLALHPAADVRPHVRVPDVVRRDWPPSEAGVEVLRSRLEVLGPVTEERLATEAALPASAVASAMASLQGEGFALQGRFTPGVDAVEWCDRRLLARIHRYTLGRLRREIRPVPAAAYLRFLVKWQHLHPETRLKGTDGIAAALDSLDGFEAPAGAWEADLLPGRIEGYVPGLLDSLCLGGDLVWARRRGKASQGRGPTRATPLAFMRRETLDPWLALRDPGELAMSPAAERLLNRLRDRGASFFGDLTDPATELPSQTEAALGELVASGAATADSFRGLRALLVPSDKRPSLRGRRRPRGTSAPYGVQGAGRWWALPADPTADMDTVVWSLLARYGVVFRRVLDRETGLPPWRLLVRAMRRLEARGEIRGGRFVAGFTGEQFALADAVAPLRKARSETDGILVAVSAADPVNLAGILTPDDRVPALRTYKLVVRDGRFVGRRAEAGVEVIGELSHEEASNARGLLGGRSLPRAVAAYLR